LLIDYQKLKTCKTHNTTYNYYRAKLCYFGDKCDRKDCRFSHSIKDLTICPDGERCTCAKCIFILHSETNRMLFAEYFQNKYPVLCYTYEKNKKCMYPECKCIHYDTRSIRF
jgi:hypothetical protein